MKAGIFVDAASTICHQPIFGERGFSGKLQPLDQADELIQPSYKEYIDPMALRRMSKIVRMGIACSADALKQAGIDQPSGIIVGTGLGCLLDTEKFLSNFLTLDGLLPPTSFILSTHNTIAGQISLNLGCHNYNITHTQNTVSFEMALIDGLMKLEEGDENVLVGAADEHIPFLNKVAEEWGYPGLLLTSGASFFVLSRYSSRNSLAEVVDTEVFVGGDSERNELIHQFLQRNGLQFSGVDLILGNDEKSAVDAAGNLVDYTALSGLYPTASAFAFHYGVDFLRADAEAKHVLVVNELKPGNLGLVLLKAIEA